MRILLTFAGATIAVLLMAGCVPPSDDVTPSPQPSSSPVFASDEEALAAAEAAYGEYLAVSDAIAADGGANPERIQPLVTPEWFEHESDAYEAFSRTGRVQRGETAISRFELQQVDDPGGSRATVVAYVCADFSATSFEDASGQDVTPIDRPTRASLEVTLVSSVASDGALLVSGSEPWPSDSFC